MKREQIYSIYTLSDPRTCKAMYVGCSSDIDVRERSWKCAGASYETRKWIRELRRTGLRPILQVVRTVSGFRNARKAEADEIRKLAAKHNGHILNRQGNPFYTWRNDNGKRVWLPTKDAKTKFPLAAPIDGKIRYGCGVYTIAGLGGYWVRFNPIRDTKSDAVQCVIGVMQNASKRHLFVSLDSITAKHAKQAASIMERNK